MIKVTEKNRDIVLLGATLLMSVIVICALMVVENIGVESVKIVDDKAGTNYKVLENKIQGLKNQNFDPNSYNTLLMEIDSSYQQELITGSAKTALISFLTTTYSDLIYNKCQMFLANNFGNSKEMLSLLNQLETISSKNNRIDRYRNQIKWYDYYSIVLPNEVNNFISPGITNYDDGRYKMLMDKVQKMPNLEPAYSSNPKFSGIKRKLTAELQQFNADFYSSGIE